MVATSLRQRIPTAKALESSRVARDWYSSTTASQASSGVSVQESQISEVEDITVEEEEEEEDGVVEIAATQVSEAPAVTITITTTSQKRTRTIWSSEQTTYLLDLLHRPNIAATTEGKACYRVAQLQEVCHELALPPYNMRGLSPDLFETSLIR